MSKSQRIWFLVLLTLGVLVLLIGIPMFFIVDQNTPTMMGVRALEFSRILIISGIVQTTLAIVLAFIAPAFRK